MRNLLFLCLLLSGAACDFGSREDWPARCDATVLGACVAGPYAPGYVERQMRMALAYWNAEADTLNGWALIYKDGTIECPGVGESAGCTILGEAVVELYVPAPRCPENSALVHEIGHVLHGDPQHLGPWWNAADEQAATLHIMHDPGASPGCYY